MTKSKPESVVINDKGDGWTEYRIVNSEGFCLGIVTVSDSFRVWRGGGGHISSERGMGLHGRGQYFGRGWKERLHADAIKWLQEAIQ